MQDKSDIAQAWDCLIVGGGPGGLTAAVYLARYRRRIVVIDNGGSRAALIPLSRNLPGCAQGLAGEEFLRCLRAQAAQYQVQMRAGTVLNLQREAEGFAAQLDSGHSLRARAVLLATGITDNRPDPPIENWDAAVKHGSIRLCPICDGFEVIDQKVALIASTTSRVEHALFLATYTPRLTLFCHNAALPLSEHERTQLAAAGVAWVDEPITGIEIDVAMKPVIHLRDSNYRFDTLYPMLGETPHSRLALDLGAQCAEDGRLIVDDKQATSVTGLYAAGDVVHNLNQISVACAQAAVAATDIHNHLRHHAL